MRITQALNNQIPFIFLCSCFHQHSGTHTKKPADSRIHPLISEVWLREVKPEVTQLVWAYNTNSLDECPGTFSSSLEASFVLSNRLLAVTTP